jgi:hypothetical protein
VRFQASAMSRERMPYVATIDWTKASVMVTSSGCLDLTLSASPGSTPAARLILSPQGSISGAHSRVSGSRYSTERVIRPIARRVDAAASGSSRAEASEAEEAPHRSAPRATSVTRPRSSGRTAPSWLSSTTTMLPEAHRTSQLQKKKRGK